MKEYRIIYMDAFTSEPFSGNPCAILPEADGLSDQQMQNIAMETNLSETAFVFRSETAGVRVRYFMPHKEIPFAGHPTIATAMMLALEGKIPLTPLKTVIDFEFNIGVLPVTIDIDDTGMPVEAIMAQKKPSFEAIVHREKLEMCFGIDGNDFLDDAPIQVVSTGVPFLMVPVKGLDILKKMQVTHASLQLLLQSIDVDAAYVFCLEGIAEDADAHGRLISAIPFSEDPFTGSAVGCMGAYIAHYGLCAGKEFTVEQGHLLGRPGQGTVKIIGTTDAVEAVTVGGCAVKTLDGFIYI